MRTLLKISLLLILISPAYIFAEENPNFYTGILGKGTWIIFSNSSEKEKNEFMDGYAYGGELFFGFRPFKHLDLRSGIGYSIVDLTDEIEILDAKSNISMQTFDIPFSLSLVIPSKHVELFLPIGARYTNIFDIKRKYKSNTLDAEHDIKYDTHPNQFSIFSGLEIHFIFSNRFCFFIGTYYDYFLTEPLKDYSDAKLSYATGKFGFYFRTF